MKKILLFFVSALLVTVSASAQTGLNIGAGVCHNFYVLNDYKNVPFDNSCYFGPYIEVGYDTDINKTSGAYFGVRYEFVRRYAAAGTYGPMGMPIVGESFTYRHYIDVPVKYRFTVPISPMSKFFFDLGPTFNFMVGNVSQVNEYTPAAWAGQRINWMTETNLYNWFNLSIGTNIGFFIDQAKVFIGYDYGGLLSFTQPEYGRGQVHQLRIGAAYVF